MSIDKDKALGKISGHLMSAMRELRAASELLSSIVPQNHFLKSTKSIDIHHVPQSGVTKIIDSLKRTHKFIGKHGE